MQRLLLASSLLLALSACSDKSAPANTADAAAPAAAPAATAPATAPELIPRDALFGNPERASVRISPDGKYLSWVAPLDGVLNVWVAPVDAPDKARAITKDTARGIRSYYWTYHSDTLLYLRDTGGDEDFHLYAVNLSDGSSKDLTPFKKTNAEVYGISDQHPDAIMVGMNDRDAKWHDLYKVDLASGTRTLVQKNTDSLDSYLLDGNYQLRYATRATDDAGRELLVPEGKGWKSVDRIPFEDVTNTAPAGLTDDGKTLYMLDSRNRDTAALYAIDTASNARTLLFEDPRADAGSTLNDPKTGVVQAVSTDYLRREWKTLDTSIAADLQKLKSLGPGDAGIAARTLDDRTWIVAYSAAETPLTYYRYDRAAGGKLTKLFSARPALEGKPLVPMWPQEIAARDGLKLVSYLSLPAEADSNHDGKADKAVPLVLFVHGGPWARDSYGSSAYEQWLANRGYAVLSVNFRGSTGFGKAFTNAGNGEWAGKMHDDLLDAVQWAVKQGVTTPQDVAIMGGSYGGYATLVGMTFTPDAFKCGVDIVGPANLNTLLGTVPPYWASFYKQLTKRMGDPATAAGKQWLTERSPLSHVDKISKPLLIGQGANDPRVKQAESDQIVNAMKAKNIPVTYVLFPDEGHGFQRPENSKAFNAVTEGFLSQCLGGRAQPIGADFEGSSITVPEGADRITGLADALKMHTQAIRK
ncbi:S9 family peptidase [Xanthomonas campestris pv. raphani]|uniref:S9 family peptidase n=1 Tax=Xanthomonas campestris TaxID=339 RepID=UPI001E5E5621|nr:S9 family peptidase [Xanthomonas campestris]MCC8691446.1 S9 family peptidase [Xanthomonas campestris]MEA9752306.1 S9 family peptidase [Xanthomonas campestris pv. raphani]MEA9812599.1 S9 family peptidase [Xanthomonas campestris pv. raphani]MEA9862192.1 S9 family peptidase [Xanthomonas campestris pv. raphani]MEA9942494.1 S9 family peptidase [Xanthomonas campestris pv. raphani]